MAIVFDTQAELEAFCEMFELRDRGTAQQIRKKFSAVLSNKEKVEELTSGSEAFLPLEVNSVTEAKPVIEALVAISEESEDLPIMLASAS